jgi:hypothetical protein
VTFIFRSLYFGERVLVELHVAKGRRTKRWYVTRMSHTQLA